MAIIRDYINLGRPHQYLKNAFVLAPVFFGFQITTLTAVLPALQAIIAFSLLCSSVYAFNDIRDRNADREHPKKRFRPVASGAISVRNAYFFSGLLLFGCLLLSLGLPLAVLALFAAYIALNICYSLGLKHHAILDVVMVAVGFVLRIFIGAVASGVAASHWLVIMTFLLALFLALAKRRDDLLLAKCGNTTRKCLDGYSMEFVSQCMALMAGVVLVAYIMYTVDDATVSYLHTDKVYLTTLWVLLGIMRYLQLTLVAENTGSPTRLLISDFFLKIVITLWITHFCFILYFITP